MDDCRLTARKNPVVATWCKGKTLMYKARLQWSTNLRLLALLVVVSGCMVFAGCDFLAMATQEAVGTPVPAKYGGLIKHSVAIVVYEDQSTSFMYPQVRQEVSSFIANEIASKIHSIHLLDYHDVMTWQEQTPGWQALPIKDIGRHFGVDRVLYLELLHYRTHAPGAQHLLQGRIEANVFVYNTKIPGSGRVFSTTLNTLFPKTGPEPVFNSDDNVVRMRTLEEFSRDLVRMFYTWRTHGNHPDE